MKTTSVFRPTLAVGALLIVFLVGFTRPPIGMQADADRDGICDYYEFLFRLNPFDAADSRIDQDGDGLTALDESFLWTDPWEVDTDNDGFVDSVDDAPLSRVCNRFANTKFIYGDEYLYTGPHWWLGTRKSGGEWSHGGWYVEWFAPKESQALLFDVDFQELPHGLILAVEVQGNTYFPLAVDVIDTNGNAVATDIRPVEVVTRSDSAIARFEIPAADGIARATIRLRRMGAMVIVHGVTLYVDQDGDGLDPLQETQVGTSDINADTDSDGMRDGWEVNEGLDPLNPADANADPDMDGFLSITEYELGTDPTCTDSRPTLADNARKIIAYWPLMTNTADVIAGKRGDLVNGAALTDGFLQLDGENDYVVLARDGNLSITGSISYCLWFAPQNTATVSRILGRYADVADDRGYAAFLSRERLWAFFSDDGSHRQGHSFLVMSPPGLFEHNEWQHLAVVWDSAKGASGLSMYVNGDKVVTPFVAGGSDITALFPAHSDLTLGSYGSRASPLSTDRQCLPSKNFGGHVTQLVLCDDALTAVEVREIFLLGRHGSLDSYLNADLDDDGLPDRWERDYFASVARTATGDPDNDGLDSACEYDLGTDPSDEDTDSDGMHDGWEVRNGFSPLDGSDAFLDTDEDGFSNLEEYSAGTDPCNPSSASAGIVYVSATQGSDSNSGVYAAPYRTISKALVGTRDGGRVAVMPGRYEGIGNRNLDFAGRAVTVTGVGGAQRTIIACGGADRAFCFRTGEDTNSILRGLTIVNGAADVGAGILCSNASPMILDCILSDNHALEHGGGIACIDGARPLIANCTIAGNSAGETGGGLYYWNSDAFVEDCVIASNTTCEVGGGIYAVDGLLLLRRCAIRRNMSDKFAAALFSFFYGSGTSLVDGCSIVDNVQTEQGALFLVSVFPTYQVSLVNSLIARNEAINGYAPGIYVNGASVLVSHCTVADNVTDWSVPGRPAVGGLHNHYGNVAVENSIFWNNSGEQMCDADSMFTLFTHTEHIRSLARGVLHTYADTPSSQTGLELSSGYLSVRFSHVGNGWPGIGNTEGDPLFTRDYRFLPDSPCIDSGSDVLSLAFDVDEECRWKHPRHASSAAVTDKGHNEHVDMDLDGLEDVWETRHFGGLYADGTGDPDGDGLPNSAEYATGTHPLRPDSDGDGLPDGWNDLNRNGRWDVNEGRGELGDGASPASGCGTDPHNRDSDGDGMPDGWENLHDRDPTDLDTDGAEDPDSDGIPNVVEAIAGTDPQDPADPTPADRIDIRLYVAPWASHTTAYDMLVNGVVVVSSRNGNPGSQEVGFVRGHAYNITITAPGYNDDDFRYTATVGGLGVRQPNDLGDADQPGTPLWLYCAERAFCVYDPRTILGKYGGTGPVPEFYPSGKKAVLYVMKVDLDVDSDNNNGASLPDRSVSEEELENPTGATQYGKFVLVNHNDDDGDGVPDYADLANPEEMQLYPLVLELIPNVPWPDLKIVLNYDGLPELPGAGSFSGVPVGNGYADYSDVKRGTMRVWRTKMFEGCRTAEDYVAPEEARTISHFVWNCPRRATVLLVEGLNAAAGARITADFTSGGTSLGSDAAKVTVAAADLGVNCNNNMNNTDGMRVGIPDVEFEIDEDDDIVEDQNAGFSFWFGRDEDPTVISEMGLTDLAPLRIAVPAALHDAGFEPYLQVNAGEIYVYPAVSSPSDRRGFLREENAARAQMSRAAECVKVSSTPRRVQLDAEGNRELLLRAPDTKGATSVQLALLLKEPGGAMIQADSVRLSLAPLKHYYTLVSARNAPESYALYPTEDGRDAGPDFRRYDWAVKDESTADADPGKPHHLVYVHGFLADLDAAHKTGGETYRRLYWSGYRGNFHVFAWEADEASWGGIYPYDYAENVENAFQSSQALMRYLQTDLVSVFGASPDNVDVMSFSLGNQVALDALRLFSVHREANLINTITCVEAAIWGETFWQEERVEYSYPSKSIVYEVDDLKKHSWAFWFNQKEHPVSDAANRIVNSFSVTDYALSILMRMDDTTFRNPDRHFDRPTPSGYRVPYGTYSNGLDMAHQVPAMMRLAKRTSPEAWYKLERCQGQQKNPVTDYNINADEYGYPLLDHSAHHARPVYEVWPWYEELINSGSYLESEE